MQKWEYTVLISDLMWDTDFVWEGKINELGTKGWEMISVIPIDSSHQRFRHFFKRPITKE